MNKAIKLEPNRLKNDLDNLLISTYPTRMPSSISVGATWSPKSTTNFANCLTFIIYFASSVSALIIFVHRATCQEEG
jgi:hypothetical protein